MRINDEFWWGQKPVMAVKWVDKVKALRVVKNPMGILRGTHTRLWRKFVEKYMYANVDTVRLVTKFSDCFAWQKTSFGKIESRLLWRMCAGVNDKMTPLTENLSMVHIILVNIWMAKLHSRNCSKRLVTIILKSLLATDYCQWCMQFIICGHKCLLLWYCYPVREQWIIPQLVHHSPYSGQ